MKRVVVILSLALATPASGCGSAEDLDASFVPDANVADSGPSDAGLLPDSWVPEPDASALDPCGSVGELRVASCGNCGSRSQRCSEDLVWAEDGPCIGEGGCAAATTEVEGTDRCGERARICSAECVWGDWDEITAPGECSPGETRARLETCDPGLEIVDTCSDACAWQPDPAGCRDACGGVGRASPAEAQEICIPAGPFVRGTTAFTYTQPVAEVMVSTFLIDRYPVTNDRYRGCVVAGGCTAPSWSFGETVFDYAPAGTQPVYGISWDQAQEFCAWDGGRRLPTEAEWEKAARGPSPRGQPYTWDDPSFRCDLLYALQCGYEPAAEEYFGGVYLIGPYDSFPGAASYYGVEMLLGAGYHWVQDFFDVDYYSLPESLVDPVGPATGTRRAQRGQVRDEADTDDWFRLSARRSAALSDVYMTVFRCARSVP